MAGGVQRSMRARPLTLPMTGIVVAITARNCTFAGIRVPITTADARARMRDGGKGTAI